MREERTGVQILDIVAAPPFVRGCPHGEGRPLGRGWVGEPSASTIQQQALVVAFPAVGMKSAFRAARP